MPSVSYNRWRTERHTTLDEIETALDALGGSERGRRLVAQQINRAYLVFLCAEFQGFCKELHSECVQHVVSFVPAFVQDVARQQFLLNRTLDRGNASPGNLGADFGRFALKFWAALDTRNIRAVGWRRELDRLNEWRNAIAHNDYDPTKLGGTILLVRQIRGWRAVCGRIARAADAVMADHLKRMTGSEPW